MLLGKHRKVIHYELVVYVSIGVSISIEGHILQPSEGSIKSESWFKIAQVQWKGITWEQAAVNDIAEFNQSIFTFIYIFQMPVKFFARID